MAALLRYVRSPVWSMRAVRLAVSSRSYVTDPSKMPTDEEQSTGLERKELEAFWAGNEDPFKFNLKPQPFGTREKPTVVKSMYNERIVGCVCDEDCTQITWMMVTEGPAHRCDCGHYFQLVKGNSIDIDI